MDRGDAGSRCGFQQPVGHAPRDPAPLAGRPHRHQYEMRMLVAEAHASESHEPVSVARDQRHHVAIGDHRADALGPVFPAKAALDQIARHRRDRLRVGAPREL